MAVITTEFTQAQVDALTQALSLGVKEVWHNGRKTEYQSTKEMLDLRDRMKLEIATAAASAASTPAPMACMTRPTIFYRN